MWRHNFYGDYQVTSMTMECSSYLNSLGSLRQMKKPASILASCTGLTSAAVPFGNPPVPWSRVSNLDTWVETVKYAYRNQTTLTIQSDDAHYDTYMTTYGSEYALWRLYSVGG